MKNEVEEGMEKEQTLKKPQGVKSALERVSSRHGIHFHRHGSLQTEFEKTLENPSMPKELVMDNIRADNKKIQKIRELSRLRKRLQAWVGPLITLNSSPNPLSDSGSCPLRACTRLAFEGAA